MPSTHLSLHYHIVFSTKDREPWLAPNCRSRVHEYLGGILRNLNGVPHVVGGTGDHVHVLTGLTATHRIADVMRELKSDSSAWIHRELGLAGFAWQEGYGGFTVGASDLDRVNNRWLRGRFTTGYHLSSLRLSVADRVAGYAAWWMAFCFRGSVSAIITLTDF